MGKNGEYGEDNFKRVSKQQATYFNVRKIKKKYVYRYF